MYDLRGLKVDLICCALVNQSNKKRLQKEFKKIKLPVTFYTSKSTKGDLRLNTHLHIIEIAKKFNKRSVLILDDNVKFLTNNLYIPIPPNKKWDMLMLSGEVQKVLDDEETDLNLRWKRVCCNNVNGYIINQSIYTKVISFLRNTQEELDNIYQNEIHPNNNCYLITPQLIENYNPSELDPDQELLDYNKDTSELDKVELIEPKSELGDKSVILKLDLDISDKDLPGVSIITPTHNHYEIFPLAVRNFYSFKYPRDKLEWIIIDDSDERQSIKDYIPNDKRIKYINCKVGDKLSISKKRNLGIAYSSYSIIAHMDDDDYHIQQSILSRVKVLLSYKKQCVGCSKIGVYDLIGDRSIYNFKDNTKSNLWEGTLLYTKEFWNQQKFYENILTQEGDFFIKSRKDQVIDMPSDYIMIALYHNLNYTNNFRFHGHTKDFSFFRLMDTETKQFLISIKETLN